MALANRKEYNAEYYKRTRDRLIFREYELQPSTIESLVDNLLENGNLSPQDKRVERLRQLYFELTGEQLPE